MKRAVCLRYKEGNRAPVLVAKGQGFIAQRIVEIAKEKNIPIYLDPNLSSVLMKLDVGNEIPTPLYEACAKVIAFVLKIKEERKKG